MKTTKTTKTTKTINHKPRVKSAAPVCSKCGRTNTHGRDCRTKSACQRRRRAAKSVVSRRAARG